MLHQSKLSDFTQWLENRGWTKEELKGEFEVLRMKWNNGPPLLVFRRIDAKEHYTTYGISQDLVKQFIKEWKD